MIYRTDVPYWQTPIFLELTHFVYKESKCTDNEVTKLYNKFKNVLKTSTSKVNLEIKLKTLNDDAFPHPLLRKRLAELKENAGHYTAHKNRKGITETTSIVDNYLIRYKT